LGLFTRWPVLHSLADGSVFPEHCHSPRCDSYTSIFGVTLHPTTTSLPSKCQRSGNSPRIVCMPHHCYGHWNCVECIWEKGHDQTTLGDRKWFVDGCIFGSLSWVYCTGNTCMG